MSAAPHQPTCFIPGLLEVASQADLQLSEAQLREGRSHAATNRLRDADVLRPTPAWMQADATPTRSLIGVDLRFPAGSTQVHDTAPLTGGAAFDLSSLFDQSGPSSARPAQGWPYQGRLGATGILSLVAFGWTAGLVSAWVLLRGDDASERTTESSRKPSTAASA